MLKSLRLLCIFATVVHGAFWENSILSKVAVHEGKEYVKNKVHQYVHWLGYVSGIGQQCSFVQHPSSQIESVLRENVKGQNLAIDAIKSIFEAWEFSTKSPIVLAITGSTGTGKTETANLLAKAIFEYSKAREPPSGLLVFRGEDFSDNYTNPISEYHEQIKSRLVQHLTKCSGNAIVVFDEVQKVIPDTLTVMMEAMSKSNPRLTYYKNGIVKQMDTSNVVFVLISDIGSEKMQRVLFDYDDRSLIPKMELMSSVKDALDEQWSRLNFGKMIDQVIPYLPLEEYHIADIIQSKLEKMNSMYKDQYWNRLVIQDGVSAFLATKQFVKYTTQKLVIKSTKVEKTKTYAKYGARNVEISGPIQRLKSKLFRFLRPWNPNADVTISYDPDAQEIAIDACYPDNSVSSKDSFLKYTCVTKWKGKL